MSIVIEQKGSYKNNQFIKYCASFDTYSPVFAGKLTNLKLIQLIKLWKNRYRQRKALVKLDQRLLDDIGLTFQQAKQEIEQPFWK